MNCQPVNTLNARWIPYWTRFPPKASSHWLHESAKSWKRRTGKWRNPRSSKNQRCSLVTCEALVPQKPTKGTKWIAGTELQPSDRGRSLGRSTWTKEKNVGVWENRFEPQRHGDTEPECFTEGNEANEGRQANHRHRGEEQFQKNQSPHAMPMPMTVPESSFIQPASQCLSDSVV